MPLGYSRLRSVTLTAPIFFSVCEKGCDFFSVEVYKITNFYAPDSILFENCVEVVSGEVAGVGDFLHRDVLVFVYVRASGVVPLAFGYIGNAISALAGDFVRLAEVADGFGAHSGLLAELVECVPLRRVGEILVFEVFFKAVFVVEVLASDDEGEYSFAFGFVVEPARTYVVLFHNFFFGEVVVEDDVFLVRGVGEGEDGDFVEVFSGNSDCPVGEVFEGDGVEFYDAVECGAGDLHQSGGIGEGEEVFVEKGLALEFSELPGGRLQPFVPLALFVGERGAAVRAVGGGRCSGDEFFAAVLADFAVGSSLCVHSESLGLRLRFLLSIFVQGCSTLSNLFASSAEWSVRRGILYRTRYKCGTNQDKKA